MKIDCDDEKGVRSDRESIYLLRYSNNEETDDDVLLVIKLILLVIYNSRASFMRGIVSCK